jgi:hypothetical protein
VSQTTKRRAAGTNRSMMRFVSFFACGSMPSPA